MSFKSPWEIIPEIYSHPWSWNWISSLCINMDHSALKLLS